MKTYLAVAEKEPGSAYGMFFPDIAGCFSASDDADGIIPGALEALRLWAQDMPLPEPSDHSEILARPEVREALGSGGYLVSVPLIQNDTGVVRANVTFERGVLKAIDEAARQRGLTRSAFLASAARHEIEANY